MPNLTLELRVRAKGVTPVERESKGKVRVREKELHRWGEEARAR